MAHAVGVDPVTFEIIRHKLNQVIDEAIFALENVSGSPTTNEGHDLMVSLYRANGELMVGGVGFLHHLTSAAQAVKHILGEFIDDPGIDEGDVYMLNDSYTAALHPPDVYIISPIYFDGLLRGFVSNFVHVTDIGAIDPGGFSPNARNTYHEGFSTKGLKIVERGRTRRDVVETFLNQVREPGLVSLDLKSQLAANHVAIERMQKLFRDYGTDTVDLVSDQLVAQSERLLRDRLRELPDGTWRTRQYVDMPKLLYRVQLELTKQDDTLTYDFTGTDRQSEIGINNSYWATWGAVFAPIFPLLAWDMTWNEGLTRPVSLVAPEGSLVNCIRPAPISVATVSMVKVVNNMTSLLIGRMLDSSDRYWRRASAVWDGCHSAISLAGTHASGEGFIGYLTDAFAGSGGALATRDGVEIGGEIPNGVSRWANAETHELHSPILYIYRRALTDSGGAGRYRGGVSHEFAITPHKAGGDAVTTVLMAKGLRVPMSIGLSGGYPGCNAGSLVFDGANVEELPESLNETRGQATIVQWGDFELRRGQIFYHRYMGGGGYGDPLDRDPHAVADDVARELVSAFVAKGVFGVVLTAAGAVEWGATRATRASLRAERIGRSVDAAFLEPLDVPRTPRRLNGQLQLTDAGVQCTRCGTIVGPRDTWRAEAVTREASPTTAGPLRESAPGLVLRQRFCPRCAAILETKVALADDEPLEDDITKWPEEAGASARG